MILRRRMPSEVHGLTAGSRRKRRRSYWRPGAKNIMKSGRTVPLGIWHPGVHQPPSKPAPGSTGVNFVGRGV